MSNPGDRFGPPPPSSFRVEPTPEQVASFAADGFVAVPRLTTDEELHWLDDVYRACFDPDDAASERTRWDVETAEDGSQRVTRAQAFFPEVSVPQLLDTTYRRNGLRFAARLLGVAEADLTTWSHMLDKPPGVGRPTYWHQDEAYWDPALQFNALGVWMPLEDCSIEMGCMQFIPGSHRGGVRPHHSRRPDIRPDLYEVIEDVDDSAAVACPLPAGGATFHHSRTMHYTAPNETGRVRRAYAIEYETAPVVRDVPASKPWVTATRAQTDGPVALRYMANGSYREVHAPS